MATTQLLNQYHQLLTRSKSFSILSKEQQTEMWNAFDAATDEQLNNGIQLVQADIEKTAKRQEEETKAAEEARKTKEENRIKKKMEMMENDKLDREESAKAADALMAQLQKVRVTNKSKKKKKLFGIF